MSKKINIQQIKDEAKSSIREEQSWLLTYADMMTLLFAFFVLLFSMSSPDPVKMSQLQEAMAEEMGISQAAAVQSQSKIEEVLEEIIDSLEIEGFAQTTRDTRGVALEIEGDLCYNSGLAEMNQELESILNVVAQNILSNTSDTRTIEVEGHSDSDPIPKKLQEKYSDNRELSSVRASRVVTYLEGRGVEIKRLKAVGYGSEWPYGLTHYEFKYDKIDVAQYNLTKEQKKKNRRIKIVFTNN